MAYTATKTLQPAPFQYPYGKDNTQKLIWERGNLVENDTATEYSTGGIGSSAFQVTAFSAVGLVTYSSFKGLPLRNGQKVVIFNTASNTNDGTFTVSGVVASSASAGTFTAVPLPGNALSGSAQTSQTAEGVGAITFGISAQIPQTFTVTAVSYSAGNVTYTYTTLVGPQIQPMQQVTIAGCTNAGNNGTFYVTTVTTTSATAGSFIVPNASGVSTDSGTGTANFQAGANAFALNGSTVVQMRIDSSKGYIYRWNRTNSTIQIFVTGASSGAILAEAALGASVTFDGTMTYEVLLIRG